MTFKLIVTLPFILGRSKCSRQPDVTYRGTGDEHGVTGSRGHQVNVPGSQMLNTVEQVMKDFN
jgi:hypothetical protein